MWLSLGMGGRIDSYGEARIRTRTGGSNREGEGRGSQGKNIGVYS